MGDRLKHIIIILTKPKEQMMAYDVFVFLLTVCCSANIWKHNNNYWDHI